MQVCAEEALLLAMQIADDMVELLLCALVPVLETARAIVLTGLWIEPCWRSEAGTH
ncbi:MAG: hypothetical protein ACPL3S_00855 [Halothiobacillaceae bacterium]